jgi:hypothetical protein
VRVGPALLEMMGALPCNVTGMTRNLLLVMMPLPMQPKVTVMTLRAMLSKIAPTRPSMNNTVRCDEGYRIWIVIRDFVCLNLNNRFDLCRVRAAPTLRRLRML